MSLKSVILVQKHSLNISFPSKQIMSDTSGKNALPFRVGLNIGMIIS